ncbi:winged helix-turn-helix domain-containing protein [Candidatus Micrarchaeota archaeon]|nr:winged helix-turn-helix domain-containing protein [Candidatus Micrarchaeota archaeon]
MKKKELVYALVLHCFFEQRQAKFTQLELARQLGISTSTVNNALSPLVKMGAVVVGGMNFRVVDAKKILLYWASARNLKKDVIFSASVEEGVSFAEKHLPAEVIFTGFTGFKFKFSSVPADYASVYVYASDFAAKQIAKRFPQQETKRQSPANLFVLKKPEKLELACENSVASNALLFVDLWNLRDWQAKEFLAELDKKMGV